jgi:hypothetical protein
MTGFPIHLRFIYGTEAEAMAIVASLGPDGFIKEVAAHCRGWGFHEITGRPCKGDLIALDIHRVSPALAVCGGLHIYTPDKVGLRNAPASLVERIWRIPQ